MVMIDAKTLQMQIEEHGARIDAIAAENERLQREATEAMSLLDRIISESQADCARIIELEQERDGLTLHNAALQRDFKLIEEQLSIHQRLLREKNEVIAGLTQELEDYADALGRTEAALELAKKDRTTCWFNWQNEIVVREKLQGILSDCLALLRTFDEPDGFPLWQTESRAMADRIEKELGL